ncbi:hypothetical protein ACFQH6_07010 [Halobacteriaceae archaeon GCM10025711]
MTVSPDAGPATLVGLVVTASFPFYLYGALYILDQEEVSWGILLHHLKFISVGLVLTTVPVVTWMIPRLFDQKLTGFAVLHAFFGLQAYALLAFALTGIARIFQVKREHDLYDNPDRDVALDDLHENMSAWRGRLRMGVAGFVVFWLFAWALGVVRYFLLYIFL